MELRVETGYRQIFKMAMPISLAMLVPQINFITNNVFLGGLGEAELASAGITGVYYLIFAVVGNGLNNGLQSLISRRAGQNLPKEIGKLFFHGIWVALAIASIGILLTYLIAPYAMRSVIHHAATADQVIHFLLIRIWGLPFLYLYVMRNALLVGTNQTKFLVWGTLAEACTNIFLDYSLIYGHFGFPAMGFDGAAYASIISEAMGLIVIYAVIHIKGLYKSFALFEGVTWDNAIIKLILIQSAPLIAQYGISVLCWEYFYILIEHHGERALAISNTMRNVFGLFGVFCWAFASTTNSMVSNILGQNRQDEVMPLIRRIVKISFTCSSVVFLVINIWPRLFLSFYGQGDAFITEGVPVLRVVSLALLMMAFGTIWLNAVTGTGNTKVNLTIELITITIYCLYVYLVLERWQLSITWGWVSECVYWTAMFAMALFYMRSGKWKGKKI
jgi:multidrug resistance protein, MATE family